MESCLDLCPDLGTWSQVQVYPHSRHRTAAGGLVLMANVDGEDFILAQEELGFTGTAFRSREGVACIQAPLNHENAERLRTLFPFTAPKPVLSRARTFGAGDRLGLATPGHLRALSRYDAIPVLAQQSMRELALTGRSFEEVLDCASFGVFREDFQKGFGADGDHLKQESEIEDALGCGYTMITLDCSDYIHNEITAMTDEEVASHYQADPDLESRYAGRTFHIDDTLQLTFEKPEFQRMVLIYGDAIAFIRRIYHRYMEGQNVDFEISIDETQTPTTPLQHFFVANELVTSGVKFRTLAPRFCGEFQKGIDYIGDLSQFRLEFHEHAQIAKHFGYKLSIHSGSDKFSVFPTIGELTEGSFHVKTAGTSWLEAMKLVAMREPALYREVHQFALGAFSEARKYYHVTTDLDKIPDVNDVADMDLPQMFQQNEVRQLIHITYGLILTATGSDGSFRFRDRLFDCWHQYAELYAQLLDTHIGNHLSSLYSRIG